MEDRKKRIMRKYLRERIPIVESESMIPEDFIEEEGVVASEIFKQTDVALQRQEPSTIPRPPPPSPRRPAPQVENPNWLLAVESEEVDPYANLFAPPAVDAELGKQDDWMITWGTQRDSSPYAGARRKDQFSRQKADAAANNYEETQQGMFKSTAFSSDHLRLDVRPASAQEGRKLYGQQLQGLDLSRDKSIYPSLKQGRIQSPILHKTYGADKRLESAKQDRAGKYTPYKSSYQKQREQQQERYILPEYQRPDPYQKWKKQNPSPDPLRKDAFIDELMPKIRR